jgi:hypothetical protein
MKRALSPFVIATPYADDRNAAVFAHFSAIYLLDDVSWLVRGVLARNASGPVIRRLALEAWDQDGPEVTTEVTHRLRVALLRDRALRQLREQPGVLQMAELVLGIQVPDDEQRDAAAAAEAAAQTERKRGRPPLLRPEDYAEIARECIALQGQRGIRATLAKEWNVSEATVRDRVKRARELGYLAESKHGKADYRPGPNLTARPKGENDG